MKSSSCARRLRAVLPEERPVPSEMCPTSSILDNTSSTDNILTCHCHCPSSRLEEMRFGDRTTSLSSKRTLSCDVCWRLHVRRYFLERLHGQECSSKKPQGRPSGRGLLQNCSKDRCSVQQSGYFDVQERPRGFLDMHEHRSGRCSVLNKRCALQERLSKLHALQDRDMQDHLSEDRDGRSSTRCETQKRDFPSCLDPADALQGRVTSQQDPQERLNSRRCTQKEAIAGCEVADRQSCEQQKRVGARCRVSEHPKAKGHALARLGDAQERLSASHDVNKQADGQGRDPRDVRERLCADYDGQEDVESRCSAQDDPSERLARKLAQQDRDARCSVHERLKASFDPRRSTSYRCGLEDDSNMHRLNPDLQKCEAPEDRDTPCDRLSPHFGAEEDSNAGCSVHDRLKESMEDPSGSLDSQTWSRWCDPRMKLARFSRTQEGPRRGEAPSRCASSVVRWNSRGRHRFAWCTALCRRLAWTIAFLLFLAPPAFAAVQRNTTDNIYKQNGDYQMSVLWA
ncbi:hypothetical protein KM043_005577 [Ampulex compressa]|nr:hypothetical protein KM043_005577 [Ampulex compressa]